MKRLSTLGINLDPVAPGYSEGELKDDTGASDGSGVIKGWTQEPIYFMYSFVKKYITGGVASDVAESETTSEVRDAIETMAGIKNPNAAEWDNAVAYAQDDHVTRLGIQYVSMVAGNTGNDPFTNQDKWLACPGREKAFELWGRGDDISGGFSPLHDYRDAAYRQLFDWGKYNVGGDTGGTGKNFEAFGIHIDGTQVTGDATLEAILKVGLAGEYPYLDIIAPDVVGTRTLMDSRGRVGRVVDAVAGDTEDVGVVQEDQFQAFQVGADNDLTGARDTWGIAYTRDVINSTSASAGWSGLRLGTAEQGDVKALKAMDDGTNGLPLTGSETRVKAFTKGVTSIFVMNEI